MRSTASCCRGLGQFFQKRGPRPSPLRDRRLAVEPLEVRSLLSVMEWSAVGPPDNTLPLMPIAIDPSSPQTMLVGAIHTSSTTGGNRIYKTADGGANWTAYPFTGREGTGSSALCFNPSNTSEVYGGTAGSTKTGGFFGQGVYKSVDGGSHWNPMGSWFDGTARVHRIACDPSGSVVYASGYGGLYRTADAGATWEPLMQLSAYQPVTGFVFGPTAGEIVVGCGYDYGIRRTDDGGHTWTKVFNMDVANVLESPTDENTLYASGLNPTFARSTDGGDTWTAISTAPNYCVRDLVIDPSDGQTLYMPTDNGVYRSEDGGDTWSHLGLAGRRVNSVTLTPDGGRVYATTHDGNVFSGTIEIAPTISLGDVSVVEGDTGTVDANFAVTLSHPSTQVVTVAYATSDGTASEASDYQAASGSVTFAPGETEKTITVQVLGDVFDEPDETFLVDLADPANATLGDSQGTGTVVDDDAPPVLTIEDASVFEGDTGTVDAVFTVALSGPSNRTVTVSYATADATATVGDSDYVPIEGGLTFSPGEVQKTITVQVLGDERDEPDETFFVNLANAINATITDGRAVGTIKAEALSGTISFRDRDGLPLTSKGFIPGNVTVTVWADEANEYQWPPQPEAKVIKPVYNECRFDDFSYLIWTDGLALNQTYSIDFSVYGTDHKIVRFTASENGSGANVDVTLTYEDVRMPWWYPAWLFKLTGDSITYRFAPGEFTSEQEQAVRNALTTWESTGFVDFDYYPSPLPLPDIKFYKSKGRDDLVDGNAGQATWPIRSGGPFWRIDFATDANWTTDDRLQWMFNPDIPHLASGRWYSAMGGDAVSLESAALHELGHVLGLLYFPGGVEGDYPAKPGSQQWSIMAYSSFGNLYWPGYSDVVSLGQINKKALVVAAYGPVDILVADPAGNVVSDTLNQIPGAVYVQDDLDGDGDPDDQITIPDPATGEYWITVIPDPDADPNERATLLVEDHGEPTVLLDQVRIVDLPPDPIQISVDRTPPVLSLDPDPIVLNPGDSWVPVHVNLQVEDETDPSPQVALVGIEPGWNTDPSSVIRAADYGEDDRDLELFAARGAEERYYTLTYAACDATGNVGHATATVYIAGGIGGRVYLDADNDGVDDGEPGIEGVAVALNGTDWLGNSVSRTHVTNENGYYGFDDVAPGTYALTEIQPGAHLDGDDVAGTLGGEAGNDVISNIVLGSGQIGEGYNFGEIESSVVQGLVWEDFNNDGCVNFGEKAIGNVEVTLTGMDDRENSVSQTQQTDGDGFYMFVNLRPGTYTIAETQPGQPSHAVDYVDGKDAVGEVNDVVAGDNDGGNPPLSTTNDQFTNVVLAAPGSVGENYNFGERPPAGGEVTPGQTATIGFWHNKHGQALISAVNDDTDEYQLGNWLASTFPNMYGAGNSPLNDAPGSNLAGLANDQVAEFYSKLFLRKKKEAVELGLSGPTKMDAQVMAVAFACYVTNEGLAGTIAADYGFLVTEHGVGVSTFNVGDSGEAFGVDDNCDELTVLDLLLATNDRSWLGVLYDMNHDGDTDDDEDELEALCRTLANNAYSAINEQGDI